MRVRFMPSYKNAWVGLRWSEANKRLELNLLPFLTVSFISKGGSTWEL